MKYIAFVTDESGEIIAINRKNEKLFNIFIIDNGPDYIHGGLFRITNGNKIGFANPKGKIVITPEYTAVLPFYDGLAPFCIGCKEELDPIIHEYTYWTGGKWGFINKKGIVIIKPEYDSVGFAKEGKRVFNLAKKIVRCSKLFMIVSMEQFVLINLILNNLPQPAQIFLPALERWKIKGKIIMRLNFFPFWIIFAKTN